MDVSFDDDEKKPSPTPKKDGGGGNTSQYHSCSGDYQKFCKSDKIKEVQACLGITTDGAFGPKTQDALKEKAKEFRFGFSDDDVKTICNKVKGNVTDDDADINVPQGTNVGDDDVKGYSTSSDMSLGGSDMN